MEHVEMLNYIEVLMKSQERKLAIMQALLEATKRQERLSQEDLFSIEEFEETVSQKDSLLQQLKELDEGFEQTFGRIRVELKEKSKIYEAHIERLQEHIRRVVDLSVEIQALEQRNQQKLAEVFAKQHKEIRQVKMSSKQASSYYKSAIGVPDGSSYFMDQKK